MNSATERKIEAILSDLRNKASTSIEGDIGKFARRHRYDPIYVTTVTVREVVRAGQDNVLKLLARSVTEVSELSKTLDAFGMLKAGMLLHLSHLEFLVEQWNGMPLSPSNPNVANERFVAVRQDSIVSIDGYRHQFKNPGGRPEEWPWEEQKLTSKPHFRMG